ncbi:MAG: alanine racemase [Lachnospiraceae bacterium]|nr:alanine racemase [Lachnospiraceae bacterium]
MYDFIPTPAVAVELDQVTANLKKMAEETGRYGIAIRPHIKPHKSSYFAWQQLAEGARGITCARLGEAEVMADFGIKDILIAFPLIGTDKMERLSRLLKRARVMTIINSVEGAEQLSKAGEAGSEPVPVLIEIDGGLHRGGVAPFQGALEFAQKVKGLQGIRICGLMYYNGLIYEETSLEGFVEYAKKEHDELVGTAGLLREHGFCMDVLSGGNSYSSRCSQYLEGITEVRCGNYIFNDCMTLATGFATEEECALRVVSTLVCKMDEYHGIIDAGSKTLTTDGCGHGWTGYGRVVGRPDLRITKLNEEHGFLESESGIGLEIGDKIAIIPNHACVLPNLTDQLYGIRNHVLERMIPVEARGTHI